MFNDSYHPAADKDSGRFKDWAVMRGAQWIGMHANCHQKYVVSLTISGIAPHLGGGRARRVLAEQRLMKRVESLQCHVNSTIHFITEVTSASELTPCEEFLTAQIFVPHRTS